MSRTITNPANASTLASATIRTELQTLEDEIANITTGHTHDGVDSRALPTSSLPLDTDGTLAANSDSLIATQKATKTYVDAISAAHIYVTVSTTAGSDYTCDGTDDDVQIQAAIDSLTSGGTVFIERGTYNITSPIEIKVSGTTIMGEGYSTVLNNQDTSGGHCIIVNKTSGTALRECHIKQLRITQNAASGTALNLSGFTKGCTVEDIYINGGTRGLYLIYGWTTVFNNVFVESCSDTGFYIANGSNKQITFINCTAKSCTTGLYHYGGDGWTLIGFNASLCTKGVVSEYGSSIRFLSPYFEGNTTYDVERTLGTTGTVEFISGDHNNVVSAATAYKLTRGTTIVKNPVFYAGNIYASYITIDSTITFAGVEVQESYLTSITNNSTGSKATIKTVSFIDTDTTLAGDSDNKVASQKATKTYADTKVTANTAITGATKTKITYDAKGLVTSGADATTADIADSSDKRYVTDAQLVVIGNTSNTNTGDQDLSGLVTKATFDANTILKADSDDTPAALTVGEQTIVGRATGGVITALSIDSDLSSVSANDDTIPSAKATKAMGDLKLPLTGGAMTGAVTMTVDDNDNYVPLTIVQNDTTNDKHALEITNNADGRAISVTNNGTGRTTHFRTDAVTVSTGSNYASNLFYSGQDQVNVPLVMMWQDGAGSTQGTLQLLNDGTGAGLFINQDGNGKSLDIDTEATTANGIDIQADALTTGTALRVYSNSADTTARTLLSIINDNAAAVGVTPLTLQQDAPTSTNYKKMASIDGVTLWKGDGTTANGTLSGTAGDILFNGGSNKIEYCTGTTNWSVVTPDSALASYALLAGRATGQSLIGGTASGDDLTLSSTSHATKGSVIINDSLEITDGNIIYVPIGGVINDYITAASAGDTLVLAAGTYTITSNITIAKALTIVGQGRGATTISTSTAGVNCFYVTSDNVHIKNLTITAVGGGSGVSRGVVFDGTGGDVFTNCTLDNVDVNITGTIGTGSICVYYRDAGGTMTNVRIYSSTTGAFMYGVMLQNAATAEATTTLKCYNCTADVTTDTSAIGFFSSDSSATQDCFLYLYNCYGKAVGVGTTVWGIGSSTGADSFCYAYNTVCDGGVYDARSGVAGNLVLTNCTLVNNLPYQPAYDGTIVTEDLYVADDATVANGGTLQVNSAGDDKNIAITHDDTNAVITTSAGNLNIVNEATAGVDWTNGNIIYVPIGGSIETYHDAATAGDTLVLASGTYTVTDDIDITKSIRILGQGERTVVACTTDGKNVFDVRASNVTIENLKISYTGASSGTATGIQVYNNITGVTLKDLTVEMLNSTNQRAIFYWIAAGDVINCKITSIAQGGTGWNIGVIAYGSTAATAATTVNLINSYCYVSGLADDAIAADCGCQAATTYMMTLNVINSYCVAVDASAANAYAVFAKLATSTCNVYNSYLSGTDSDAYATSSGVINVYGSDLKNSKQTAVTAWDAWNTWTPTLTWTTADPTTPTTVARYRICNGYVEFMLSVTTADGQGATGLTATMPITPKNISANVACSGIKGAGGSYAAPAAYIDTSDGLLKFRSFGTFTDDAACSIEVSGRYEI